MCSICFANSAAASLLILVRLRRGKRMERRPLQYEPRLANRVRSGLFESQARVWHGPATFQEAISNAVRHAKPTVVRVTLRWDPPNLTLKAKDDGSGISRAK